MEEDFRRSRRCCANGLDRHLRRPVLSMPAERPADAVHPRRASERLGPGGARGADPTQRCEPREGAGAAVQGGRSLSVEQVRLLLQEAKGHRLYALYVVAATMGLRRGSCSACDGSTWISIGGPSG